MKKVKILGKSIPVFVLLLLGVGLVSGALVTYLSNKVQADVAVESPIVQDISKGSGYSAGPVSFDIYGGESITLWVKTENKANVAITGKGENIVNVPEGVTCADFTSVSATTTSTYLSAGDVPSTVIAGCTKSSDTVYVCGPYPPICSPINNWNVEFAYGPTPIVWAAGQIDETETVVTFKTNAVGTYTFTSEIVPV